MTSNAEIIEHAFNRQIVNHYKKWLSKHKNESFTDYELGLAEEVGASELAQSLITCEKCRYCQSTQPNNFIVCEKVNKNVQPDHFCGYGEKR